MTPYAVGIDLGTTFSTVAHLNAQGQPEVLPNIEGERITPSVILFEGDDVVVGNYAEQASTLYPEQVIKFVKRHMGDDGFKRTWKGRDYSATELSHFILAKLKHDVELRLGHPVERAVITVPAYFNDKQRRATLKAGQLAGFDVLALLNEPTAAAFAYGLDHMGESSRVLVFDLGGGTFDVTLVDLGHQEINVIATRGDHQLGGKDWDDIIIAYVARTFQQTHGVDPLSDPTSAQELRGKCSAAKLSLSRRPRRNIFHEFDGKVLQTTLTRDEFEVLSAPLVQRCHDLTMEVLQDAGVDLGSVDKVLLAGGSTRMPMIRKMLKAAFDKEPSTDINPDEAIAMGAAIVASLENAARGGESAPVELRTQDVTSHSLGLLTLSDADLINHKLIPRNSRIPTEQSFDQLVTTHEGQTEIDVWMVQGESANPEECVILGHFSFYDLPPRPAGETRLEITYRYNANAIVEVEARDVLSGTSLPFRIIQGNVSLQDVLGQGQTSSVMVTIDCSGSMFGAPMKAAKRAAKDMVERLLAQPGRQVGVVACPGGIKQLPTTDFDRVLSAIDGMFPMGKGNLQQTLTEAHHSLHGNNNQMVFALFTDGIERNDESLIEQANQMKARGVEFITVGVGPRARVDLLKSLASSDTNFHSSEDLIEIKGSDHNLPALAPVS